jgi:hypothetical protein
LGKTLLKEDKERREPKYRKQVYIPVLQWPVSLVREVAQAVNTHSEYLYSPTPTHDMADCICLRERIVENSLMSKLLISYLVVVRIEPQE